MHALYLVAIDGNNVAMLLALNAKEIIDPIVWLEYSPFSFSTI